MTNYYFTLLLFALTQILGKTDISKSISPQNVSSKEVEIQKDSTFSFAQLRSDTFDVSFEETSVTLSVEPIGEKANLDLEGSKTFITQPSSKMQVILPLLKVNANHQENFGIVQLVDLQGNPVIPKFDVKSKIVSSSDSVIQIIDDAVIPQGTSYSAFPIKTTGNV